MKNSLHTIMLVITGALLLCGSVYGDGLIVVPPPPNSGANPYPLQVKFHHVSTSIVNMIATTNVDQEFYNPTGRRLEGYYIFPIPENAIIDKFSMFIDGKETEAELLDATKARKVYEDIVRKLIDPALLEYYGKGMFKARIFPIEPNSTKRVKISYKETLEKNNGTVGYTYPLNTEKFSSSLLDEASVEVAITTTTPLKNVYCPSHDAEVKRKNNKEASIVYKTKNSKPDRDFTVFFTENESKFGVSLLTTKANNDDGFFFLNISPDFEIGKSDVEPKDIAFVLDVSGSMAGKKLDQAKAALRFCVANLNINDRFEVIRFSTDTDALFGKLTKADKAGRDKAAGYIDNLKAIGGTNIEEGLQLAFKAKSGDNRPYMILFITDGKPTIGKTSEDELVAMIKNTNTAATRIFTFGIGDEINTHLLDKFTEITNAYRTYVTPDEDIEVKVSDIYTKIQSPLFTDLTIDFGNAITAKHMYPKKLPDLFHGSSITILGKYSGSGSAKIKLSGRIHGEQKTLEYAAAFPESKSDNAFIAPLWAARRIGYLLDQIRLNGSDKELVDEVTQLAKTYGIITPYTSYLIVEDDDRLVQNNRMSDESRTFSPALRKKSGTFVEEKRLEFESMKSKSGAPSARASSELQALNQSVNTDQIKEKQSRLEYKDDKGVSRNITRQVKMIQGRAFYNNGQFWTDIELQKQKQQGNKKRIQYASTEYYNLINQYPESSQYLALGRNVQFVMNQQIFEIFE
ncbi:MAG: VIT domain-containing protein [Fibrobacterota bacterium]